MAQYGIVEGAYSKMKLSGYHVSSCGYCKDELGRRTPESRASYYTTSNYLLPTHYQALMDRGWRRSGNLLYLPDLARSCCPHYTIRIPVAEFKPSRDQRQAVHRWNKFVLGEQYLKELDHKYPLSKVQKKAEASTFDLYKNINKCEQRHVKQDLQPAHSFEVTLEHDTFTEEKYALYQHYQQEVHHEGLDEVSRSGFRRFLCDSPVQRHNTSSKKRIGSYHQCYRLDGRLIAIGVLDLLPHAVSGVYFIYHNDFEKYSMGKLSALREAALAEECGYQYYYMGYYIHGCEKMKYKATYQPQYVLDVQTYAWDLFDEEMRTLMSKKKFVCMSLERNHATKKAASTDTKQDITMAEGDETLHESGTSLESGTELEDQWELPDPVDATMSDRSLLDLGMPGVLSAQDMLSCIELNDVMGRLNPDFLFPLRAIKTWGQDSVYDRRSTKGHIAELAGCVGPDVFKEVIIDFQDS